MTSQCLRREDFIQPTVSGLLEARLLRWQILKCVNTYSYVEP